MPNKMLFLPLCLLLYPLCVISGKISCQNPNQCENTIKYCTNDEDCTIICSSVNACYGSTFICPSSNNNCDVQCDSSKQTNEACTTAKIIGNNSLLSVEITGYNSQFRAGVIHCGNSSCNIQCGHSAASDQYMCSSARINASNATNLNLNGYGAYSLEYATIICPKTGDCNITVTGNTGALIPNSKIYIHQDQYTTRLFLTCKAENIVNCYGGSSTNAEPILYCYDGKYHCSLVTSDGINWHCKNKHSPCDYIPIVNTSTTAVNITTTSVNITTTSVNTTTTVLNVSTTSINQSTTFIPTTTPHDNHLSYSDTQYLIISIFVLISIGIILCLSLSKFREYKTVNTKMKPWIFYIAVINMSSIWISYFIWISIILLDLDENVNKHLYTVFSVVMYSFFAISWMSLYMYMFNKLYQTFKESSYKISNKYIYFHMTILLFIPIWYALITVSNTIISNENIHIYLLLSLIGSLIVFMGLISLIVSFNKKLHQVIILSSNYYNSINGSNNFGHLLRVITKHTLLGTIMIVNMTCFVIIVLVLTCLRTKEEDKEWIIYEWITAVLIICNSSCMFFGFQMNENHYNKIYKTCHMRLISLCKLLSMLSNPNDDSLIIDSIAKPVFTDLQFEDSYYSNEKNGRGNITDS